MAKDEAVCVSNVSGSSCGVQGIATLELNPKSLFSCLLGSFMSDDSFDMPSVL